MKKLYKLTKIAISKIFMAAVLALYMYPRGSIAVVICFDISGNILCFIAVGIDFICMITLRM